MKKSLLVLLLSALLFSCNHRPDPQPLPSTFQLNVYPNPAFHSFSIGVYNSSKEPYILTVFDTEGKILMEDSGKFDSKDYDVDLEGRPEGIYPVVFQQNGVSYCKNLIKL